MPCSKWNPQRGARSIASIPSALIKRQRKPKDIRERWGWCATALAGKMKPRRGARRPGQSRLLAAQKARLSFEARARVGERRGEVYTARHKRGLPPRPKNARPSKTEEGTRASCRGHLTVFAKLSHRAVRPESRIFSSRCASSLARTAPPLPLCARAAEAPTILSIHRIASEAPDSRIECKCRCNLESHFYARRMMPRGLFIVS